MKSGLAILMEEREEALTRMCLIVNFADTLLKLDLANKDLNPFGIKLPLPPPGMMPL